MWCFRNLNLAAISCSILMMPFAGARAEGFVLGLGAEADSANGRAISAFGDWGVGDHTWLSATISGYEVDGIDDRRRTTFAGVGIDHWLDPAGIRLGASYWGNSDILDSTDLTASVYYRNESFLLSVDYERRDFDFVVLADFAELRRTADFSADGLGIGGRMPLGAKTSIQFGGIAYEYSRNIRLQPDIDVLRFLSSSRLSMVNSLIDHRIGAGIEFAFGLRSLDLTAGSWQTAVDGGRVNSISVGYLTPVTDRTDVELRLSFDNSDNFGHTTAFSIYVYYFGGA
jgi:hypothetical protein